MSKTYRVCGRQRVFGQRPGSEFVAELDPKQEARMLARGSLEVVEDTPKRADKPRRKPWKAEFTGDTSGRALNPDADEADENEPEEPHGSEGANDDDTSGGVD